jgi:prepilin-type processing-associated H-X9-DG protein
MKTSQRREILRRGSQSRFLFALFVFGVWLCVPCTALAQANEPAVPAAVASTLDEQTFGVLGIDTARVDLDSLAQQISTIPILTERQRSDLALHKKDLGVWFEQFRQAGGREIWIVVTLAGGLAENPFVVVPLSEGANRQMLEGLFVSSQFDRIVVMDRPFNTDGSIEREGAVVFGSNAALARLRGFHGPTRAIPKSALEAVAGAEIRAFVLPTDDQRRVLSEFLRDPQAEREIVEHMAHGRVPAEFLRNPGEIARLALGEGLQWIAVGITTRENLALNLTIGSKDAASAKALDLWLAGAWQYARQHVAAQREPDSAMIAGLLDQFSRLLAPRVSGDQLSIHVDMKQLMASAAGAFLGQAAFGAAKRAESTVVRNHLKELGIAMHNYHDVYKQFPPAAIRDAKGRPLLSWRVALLPFMEENKLYQQFHLDEPWDSPHNKPLIAKMPEALRPRSATLRAAGKTTLLVPIGKQTVFGPPEGVPIREITDGTSNTILIVDADEADAVAWTKPDDLNVDGVDAKQVVFGTRKDGVSCAFADGHVERLDPQFTADLVHALLTRNGGEAIPRQP